MHTQDSPNDTHLDLCIESYLLWIVLLVLIWIHAQVVECKLLLDALLECLTLLERERIALCNDGNHVDKLAELLEHHNVDWLQCMATWLNEEQAAVDSGVLQIPLTLSGELLAQIRRVLVLDVLDNRVPAALVVDQIAVAWGVDNVEP